MIGALLPIAVTLAKQFLPDLVGSLAGKNAEAVASKVLGVAGGIVGSEIKTEADGIAAIKKLKANPDMALQLEMQLSEERLELARTEMQDRVSARTMSQKSTLHTIAVCGISTLVVMGFGVMLWLILGDPLPDGNTEIIYILLGTLAASFTQVINFWLGSSRSSQDKSQQMSDAARR
tara:strand:+ start:246 stop:776 length:531 start_codon:yes stop_codon:yes gene_type:complete